VSESETVTDVTPDPVGASPKQRISDWATANARLLLILLILAILPYLFTCWGIALVVSRGSCGGG